MLGTRAVVIQGLFLSFFFSDFPPFFSVKKQNQEAKKRPEKKKEQIFSKSGNSIEGEKPGKVT